MNATEILAKAIAEAMLADPEFLKALYAAMDGNVDSDTENEATENETEVKEEKWYDRFRSDNTKVVVKGATVQVTVARGHANEWHDELRAAGFRWSRKNHNWWAWLDDARRGEIAARNRATDAETAGMTAEEKRAYWAARKSSK